MLAAADTCNASRHGQERGRRLFLAIVTADANIGFAALSLSPIGGAELCFAHGCEVAMLGGARKRQLLLVLSALLVYVIACRFDMGSHATNANENKEVTQWVS